MQFLFRRFKNINKICQASESRLRELTETEGVKSVFGHFERVITLPKAEMGPCSALTLSVIWRWRNLFPCSPPPLSSFSSKLSLILLSFSHAPWDKEAADKFLKL